MPYEPIWRLRSGSTLAQVMGCCLTALIHYLNQCWLLINEVLSLLWHSPESNCTVNAQITVLYNEFENYTFKIIPTSPRGQWVNIIACIRWRYKTSNSIALVLLQSRTKPSIYTCVVCVKYLTVLFQLIRRSPATCRWTPQTRCSRWRRVVVRWPPNKRCSRPWQPCTRR